MSDGGSSKTKMKNGSQRRKSETSREPTRKYGVWGTRAPLNSKGCGTRCWTKVQRYTGNGKSVRRFGHLIGWLSGDVKGRGAQAGEPVPPFIIRCGGRLLGLLAWRGGMGASRRLAATAEKSAATAVNVNGSVDFTL